MTLVLAVISRQLASVGLVRSGKDVRSCIAFVQVRSFMSVTYIKLDWIDLLKLKEY